MRFITSILFLVVGAVLFSFGFLISDVSTEAQSQTIVVTAISDAYVYSFAPFTNYGTTDDLRLGRAYTEVGPVQQRIYLRFPPVTLPEGQRAAKVYLQLYQDMDIDEEFMIAVHIVRTPWEEEEITWANQPGIIGAGTFGFWGGEQGWKQKDMLILGGFNPLNWPFDRENFGLVVSLSVNVTTLLDVTYRSRNDPRYAPRLIVKTEPIPTPTPTPTPWPTPTPISNLAPGAVNLKVEAIEVTQGIQDLNNSVRLVQDKRTFVRVYASSSKNTYWTYAYLRVKRGAQERTVYPLNGYFGHLPVSTNPKRSELDDAFLFELPAGFRQGTVSITAYLNPDTEWRDPTPAEYDYSDNVKSVTVSFEKVPPLYLVLYRIHYYVGSELQYTPPSHAMQLVSWLQRAYPVSQVIFWTRKRLWPTLAEVDPDSSHLTNPSCNKINASLNIRRTFDTVMSGLYPMETLYYGMVIDNGYFMRGCSWGKNKKVASGPTGDPAIAGRATWDVDGSYGDWYGAHELGHSLGRGHANFCGAEGGPPYPYPEGRISPTVDGNTALYGFDIQTRKIYSPFWTDVMSYCKYEWISDFTYEGIMGELLSAQTARTPSTVFAPYKAVRSAQGGRYQGLLVRGTIDLTTGRAELLPAWVMPTTLPPSVPVPGDYTIVLRGVRGELARYPFQPEPVTAGPPLQTAPDMERNVTGLFFSEMIPYAAGTLEVAILGPDGSQLASVQAGANPPTVTVLSPNGRERVSGRTLTVTWTAQDPDGDPLSFLVQYSADGGFTWETLATGISSTRLPIPVEDLVGGTQYARVRVWASDGIHTAMDESDSNFTVPNHPPTLRILSPEASTQVVVNQTLNLEAEVYDVELGSALGETVQWRSSLDGYLGAGSQLSVVLRTPGTHRITAQVDDGQEGTARDAVQIVVLATPEAPPRLFLPLLTD